MPDAIKWDDEPAPAAAAVKWDDEAAATPAVKWDTVSSHDTAPDVAMASSHGPSMPFGALPKDRVSTFSPPTPKGPTLSEEPLLDVRKITRDPVYQATARAVGVPEVGEIAAEGLGGMTTPTGIGQLVGATMNPGLAAVMMGQGALDLPAQAGSVAGSLIGGDPEAAREELPGLVTNAAMMLPAAAHGRGAIGRALRGEVPVERPATLPQEATTQATPAPAMAEKATIGPHWNELGEDVRYQHNPDAPGVFVKPRPVVEPEIPVEKIAEQAAEQAAKDFHPDATREEINEAQRIIKETLDAAKRSEGDRGARALADAERGNPREEAANGIGRDAAPVGAVREPEPPMGAGREEGGAAVDSAARAGEAEVPAAGERKADEPVQIAALPEGAREVRLDRGLIQVRGNGAATYYRWADPSYHNGPFGDHFVIASPELRAEIEAAEGGSRPPRPNPLAEKAAGDLPPRTADTMSEAIALSSPNGRMSKRAKAAADARLGKALFGEKGLQRSEPAQPTEAESLLRQAKDLRELADRGMSPRKNNRVAAELEAKAAALAEKAAEAVAPEAPAPVEAPKAARKKPFAEPVAPQAASAVDAAQAAYEALHDQRTKLYEASEAATKAADAAARGTGRTRFSSGRVAELRAREDAAYEAYKEVEAQTKDAFEALQNARAKHLLSVGDPFQQVVAKVRLTPKVERNYGLITGEKERAADPFIREAAKKYEGTGLVNEEAIAEANKELVNYSQDSEVLGKGTPELADRAVRTTLARRGNNAARKAITDAEKEIPGFVGRKFSMEADHGIPFDSTADFYKRLEEAKTEAKTKAESDAKFEAEQAELERKRVEGLKEPPANQDRDALASLTKKEREFLETVGEAPNDHPGFVNEGNQKSRAALSERLVKRGLMDGDRLNAEGKRLAEVAYRQKERFKNGVPFEEYVPGKGKVESNEAGRTGGWLTAPVKGREWYSNGHFAVEGTPPKGQEVNTRTHPPMEKVLPAMADLKTEVRPVGYAHEGGDHVRKIVFSNGTWLNADYFDHVNGLHPNAKLLQAKPDGPVVWVEGKRPVAAVMPMRAPKETPGIAAILEKAKAGPAPAAPAPKAKAKRLPFSDTEAKRAEYFKPGAIVDSYGGTKDRVIEYHPGTPENEGRWSVDVQGLDKNGNPDGSVRNHATEPDWPRLRRAEKRKPFASESEGPFQSVGSAASTGMDSPSIRGVISHLAEQLRRESNDVGTRIGDAIGNRGLRFAEQASEKGAQKLAASGSAEAKARVMVGDLVTKAKDLGLDTETAIKTLIEGQKEGARDRYTRLADEVREAGPDDILELYRDEIRPVLEGLKGRDAAEKAAKMDPDALHDYLARTFDSAAKQVKIHPDAAGVRETPEYQEWIEHYKKNFGDKLQKAHEEAGGTTLKDLGPDNTYFPLTADVAKPGLMSRLTPFKTRPARSAFRTGHAENYLPDLDALVKATHQIIKQDGLHAGLQELVKAGAIKEYAAGARPPEIQMVNGREVKTIVEPLGNGKVYAIPEDLHAEVKPIIEGMRETRGFLQKIFGGGARALTEIQLGGITDASAHGANILAATLNRAPAIGYALAKKAATDSKVVGAFKAWKDAFDTDPFKPENKKYLDQALEDGAVGSRYGRTSYTEKGAALTGGKTLKATIKENPLKGVFHAAGPLLNGPKGMDIRARIAFYKALDVIAPDATWGQRVKWANELGNYNPAMQDALTRAAKKSNLAPFVVAGRTFNALGAKTVYNPISGVPGAKGATNVALRAAQLATSPYALAGAWWLAHMAITGKTPTEAHANLFEIEPTEDMKRSPLGMMMGLDKKGAKLTMNFPLSMPMRGARATGVRSLYNDTFGEQAKYHKKGGEVAADMTREVLNTQLHPFEGPPVKDLFHLAGMDLYITKDPKWKGGAEHMASSIPEGTPENERLKEKAKSFLIGLNPMIEKLAGEKKNTDEYLADSLMPRLVKHPFKPKKWGQK